MIAGAGLWYENFPETVAAHAHGMAAAIPRIEIANDANAAGVRDKHREGHAGHAVQRHWVRTELVVERKVIAIAEQMEVEIGQDGRKAVGILELDQPLPEARAQV